ncbi:hypothetical protein AU255_08610 [Methyloprofundus sedimenti]|uniref:Uncharacterized protein n=1 Tax=Methyloprofundus sedimenti TaxID=1420851 RepID=A0A1V8M8N4_9GAMM|nr:hypothetical protein [Methyloprofundus sedimenti]OQK17907.1 hypothetical protein AU255_08610 [Methyloprofundus sedimenti]
MSPSQNKAAMQEHIPQWQASRLTQAEYCKAHDIKPYIFSLVWGAMLGYVFIALQLKSNSNSNSTYTVIH